MDCGGHQGSYCRDENYRKLIDGDVPSLGKVTKRNLSCTSEIAGFFKKIVAKYT